MTGDILIVTGSRLLASRARGKDWALPLIRSSMEGVSTVVAGDAEGPDTWAREICLQLGLDGFFYCLDGAIRDPEWLVLGRWAEEDEVPAWVAPERPRWPTTRNLVMVRAAAARGKATGRQVRGLGLVDSLSPTGGTIQTIRSIRAAHIPVRTEEFFL